MNHFRETAAVTARLYARAERPSQRETCGDLLRAVSQADREIVDEAGELRTQLRLVRELVLLAAGGAWLREHEHDACVARLRDAGLLVSATHAGASTFDAACADVLRARFPETAMALQAQRS